MGWFGFSFLFVGNLLSECKVLWCWYVDCFVCVCVYIHIHIYIYIYIYCCVLIRRKSYVIYIFVNCFNVSCFKQNFLEDGNNRCPKYVAGYIVYDTINLHIIISI